MLGSLYRKREPQRIALVHGPHMGDGIICLPLAGVLKQRWPGVHITGIGPSRFRSVLMASPFLDDFLSTEDAVADPRRIAMLNVETILNPYPDLEVAIAAAQARVPVRVANLRRTKLIPYSNRFVFYGRRRARQHEAMLHLKELRALGVTALPAFDELHRYMALTRVPPMTTETAALLDPQRFNLILHTGSNGNAREWPLAHFLTLARTLPPSQYRLHLTGIACDREKILREVPQLLEQPHVVDLCGKLCMEQLVAFVHAADGLIACSTGPLHLASVLGIRALGLFPPREGLDISRWGPVGARAEAMTLPDTDCKPKSGGCPKRMRGDACACMEKLAPSRVFEVIERWRRELPPRS